MVESHTHSLIRFICLRLPVCLSDLGWNHQELPSCEPNWEQKEIRALVRPTAATKPVRKHGGLSHLASSLLSSHRWAQNWSHPSCLLLYLAEVEYHWDDKTKLCVCVCVRSAQFTWCNSYGQTAQTKDVSSPERSGVFTRQYCSEEIQQCIDSGGPLLLKASDTIFETC